MGSLDHEYSVPIRNVSCLSQTLINPLPSSLIHPGCPLWQIVGCKQIQEYLISKTRHSECSMRKCANRRTSFYKTHDHHHKNYDLRKNKLNPRWDESFLTVSIENAPMRHLNKIYIEQKINHHKPVENNATCTYTLVEKISAV